MDAKLANEPPGVIAIAVIVHGFGRAGIILVRPCSHVRAMPHFPCVTITGPGAINARVGVNISGRAVGPIVHGGAVATNRLRQDLVEDLGSPWARVKIIPDRLVHGLHLIASSPQRQTRMISETAGLIVSLGTDLGHELFIVAGIVNAGEHKVVPHEDAVFVTGSHEGVGSVDTAAPDAHHRHIGIAAGSDKVVILLGSHRSRQHRLRDQIGATGKDWHAIDNEREVTGRPVDFGIVCVGGAVHLDGADTCHAGISSDRVGVLIADLDVDLVEGRLAQVMGPPQLRVIQLEIHGG